MAGCVPWQLVSPGILCPLAACVPWQLVSPGSLCPLAACVLWLAGCVYYGLPAVCIMACRLCVWCRVGLIGSVKCHPTSCPFPRAPRRLCGAAVVFKLGGSRQRKGQEGWGRSAHHTQLQSTPKSSTACGSFSRTSGWVVWAGVMQLHLCAQQMQKHEQDSTHVLTNVSTHCSRCSCVPPCVTLFPPAICKALLACVASSRLHQETRHYATMSAPALLGPCCTLLHPTTQALTRQPTATPPMPHVAACFC
jgi:hypothetical protein